MGISGGPKIVTNNLAVALDANDKNSYPGSGTTWYDVSNNGRDFTLTNGPTFDSSSAFSFKFDGTNDYATKDISSDTPMKIENFIYANHTYEIWFNLSTFTPSNVDATESSQALIAWPGYHNGIFITNSPNNNIIANYLWNSSRNSIFSTTTTLTGSYVNLVTTGSWCCIHDIIDYTNTKSLIYINGVNVTTLNQVPASSMTSAQGSPANTINIGAARISSNYKFLLQNGRISSVKLYNKVLSASEILQNYNVQKSRFGL
jgi:hypothetical protein